MGSRPWRVVKELIGNTNEPVDRSAFTSHKLRGLGFHPASDGSRCGGSGPGFRSKAGPDYLKVDRDQACSAHDDGCDVLRGQ